MFTESSGHISPNIVPSDIEFNSQWALSNPANSSANIHAEAAWNILFILETRIILLILLMEELTYFLLTIVKFSTRKNTNECLR